MQAESDGMELIIILALVAGFIIFQLRRTLGKKTGYDPTKDHEQKESPQKKSFQQKPAVDFEEDKIVPLRPGIDQEEGVKNLGISKSSPFYGIIEQVNRLDPSFTLPIFFDGAESAYGLILNSFWAGDKKNLRSMLSRDVYDQFSGVMATWEKNKYHNENKLMDIEKIDLDNVSLTGSMAEVMVEFTSHMIMALRDGQGNLIEGDDKKTVKVIDIWTFCRDVKSRDPNWTLVATRSG